MQNSYRKPPAPCIVNEGILINRTDMLRALETLEGVRYTYFIDGDPISRGEGVVVKVFANTDHATLIVNGCLFLNILSFNYVRFYTQENGQTMIELVEDTRMLQLTSIDEDSRKTTRFARELYSTARYDDEGMPAELFDDAEDDDRP